MKSNVKSSHCGRRRGSIDAHVKSAATGFPPSSLARATLLSLLAAGGLAACGGGGSDPAPAEPTPTEPLQMASCAQLVTDPAFGFAGDPEILAGATSVLVENVPTRNVTNGVLPDTPAHCEVNLTYSPAGMGGVADGYDVGQTPKIAMRVLLPLSALDGGSGGVQGSWNGKVMVSGGSGMSGSTRFSAFTEGVMRDNNEYAIRLGYVGVGTDTGQGAPGVGDSFGIIQTGALANTLALGAIKDWSERATKYGKDMAQRLADVYYRQLTARTYYNGCSGGGNMGMGQLQNYGDEYDGILIGAPAMHWQEFRLADGWPAAVMKAQQLAGKALPTSAQVAAANAAATAACDAADGLVDGLVADPRACTFSAKANICGVAGAPTDATCVSAEQAEAIDRVWAGPRTEQGVRIFFPHDRGISFGVGTSIGGSTGQVMRYNHRDRTFDANRLFADNASRMIGNPANGITYEEESTLSAFTTLPYMENSNPDLDKVKAHGTKVIHTHGTLDGAIRWRHSVDYYRKVALRYGSGVDAQGRADYSTLQSWYRFYAMPGVGHCGGGAGPSAMDPFLALEKWVEKGEAPDRLFAQAQLVSNQPPAGKTRPLCPYPTFAVYDGTGNPDDWNSFSCQGNLESNPVALCQMQRVKPGEEATGRLNTEDTQIPEALCRVVDKGL